MIDIADIQKDIGLIKNRIRALQNETVHCIAIKPTGEIEVVDKTKLEELNGEVDRLTELAGRNERILARLMELTGGATVEDLMTQKRKLDDHIQKTNELLRLDLSTLLRTSPGLTLENIGSHPKAAKLQADADDILSHEAPELERLTDLLAQVDEVLQAFQPSNLKEATAQHTPFVGGF